MDIKLGNETPQTSAEQLTASETQPLIPNEPAQEQEERTDTIYQTPPAKVKEQPPVVNAATGKVETTKLDTADTLTTIADQDEKDFIEKVEETAHGNI
jgi:hypothetical protein